MFVTGKAPQGLFLFHEGGELLNLWYRINSLIIPVDIYFFLKFIYFWPRWIFVAAHSLSLVVKTGPALVVR